MFSLATSKCDMHSKLFSFCTFFRLHGSYEALKGGNTVEAMEDFTGGVSEEFGLKDNTDKRLFGTLKKAYDRDSQLGCSINAKPGVTEAKLPNGLICGHAYTITDLKRVMITCEKYWLMYRVSGY